MHEILIAIAAVVMFLSPCIVASLGNTQRRWHRAPDKNCPEVDRRDRR